MTKISAIFTKVPGSIIYYTMDWADWLNTGDTLVASSWIVPSGISQIAATFDSTTSTIRASGGVACGSYEIENLIQTSGGESTARSFVLFFRNW